MAILKIPGVQEQIKPASSNVQFQPLSLRNVDTNTDDLGKVFEKLILLQKEEEDTNKAQDIVDTIIPDISLKYNTIKKTETNIEKGLTEFSKYLNPKTYENELAGENRAVKKKVEDWLRGQRTKFNLQLGNDIMSNSIEKSKVTKGNVLDNIITRASSNDLLERSRAENDFKNFFKDPNNISFYGAKGIQDLQSEKNKELVTLRLIRKTENGEVDLTDDKVRNEISSYYDNKYEAAAVLKRIQTIQASKIFQESEKLKLEEKTDIQNKINNFTTILNLISSSRNSPTDSKLQSKVPTVDELYDFKNAGRLNDVQYSYLLRILNNPEYKPTNDRMMETINLQMSLANTVERIDLLQNGINLNNELLKDLSPNDLITYNGLLEKFKADRDFQKDYKKYQDLIKVHTKNITRGIFSFANTTASQQALAVERLNEYNQYSLTMKPEEAYLKTLNNMSKEDLPTLADLPIRKELQLQNFSTYFEKYPTDGFNEMRKKSAEDFKNKKISMKQYQQDISDIDIINDVYEVRKGMYGEDEKNIKNIFMGVKFQSKTKP